MVISVVKLKSRKPKVRVEWTIFCCRVWLRGGRNNFVSVVQDFDCSEASGGGLFGFLFVFVEFRGGV